MKVLSFLSFLLTSVSLCAAMTDKATGINFPAKNGALEVFGVGVRKKGKIQARKRQKR